MKLTERGCTLAEMVIVITVLGGALLVAIPRFIDLRQVVERVAVEQVDQILISASNLNHVNYIAFDKKLAALKPGVVSRCQDVIDLLNLDVTFARVNRETVIKAKLTDEDNINGLLRCKAALVSDIANANTAIAFFTAYPVR